MDSMQNQDTQPAEEKKNSLTSRALVATAFGGVFATKINNIGTIIDSNNVLKEHNLTFGQKVRAVFTGELFGKLKEKYDIIKATENKNMFTAGAKVLKYTIITTVIGAVAGAALGWTLGGRIENWKDIFKHPWQSTKIIFGIEKPKTESAQNASIPTVGTPETSTKWQDYSKERQQNSGVAGRTV